MRRLSMLALTAFLAGCATATPPTEVTRFHRLADVTARGSFLIAPPTGQSGPDGEWATYASAVAAQLRGAGFTCAADFGSACVDNGGDRRAAVHHVTVRIERQPFHGGVDRGSGVGVGVGGSTGSYGSGVGVGVGVDLTRLINGPGPDVILRLSVRIDRAGSGEAIWEGRAETAVRNGAPAAQPGLAAARLAAALFAGFPGRSGETITVP